MAKRKKPTGKRRGKSVASVGKFANGGHDLDALEVLVTAEGGAIVDMAHFLRRLSDQVYARARVIVS